MSESYNIKVIEYGNGTVEIRTYSDIVERKTETTLEEEISFYEEMTGQRAWAMRLMSDKPERPTMTLRDGTVVPLVEEEKEGYETMYNPFTDKTETLPDIAIAEMLHRHSVQSSLNRTVQAVYKYSRQCDWEYFITLTFSEEHADRYDFSNCMKKASKWFNHQKDRYAKDMKYLIVPEMHKNGAWHIHGVIADTGTMSIVDSGRVAIGKKAYKRTEANKEYPTIYNLSGWKLGWSTATAVTDTYKVSTYITKYITKDLCESSKGKKRYYRSRNIPEPEENTYLIPASEREEFLQAVADSIGMEIEYEKSLATDYVTVDYRFYKRHSKEKEGREE